MKKLFDITLKNRKLFYRILQQTPKEQLALIPDGYRNNIWWNIAHVVVTQQLLLYKLSGLPMNVSQELVDKYRKGTVPDGTIDDGEVDLISAFLLSTAERAEADYANGLFKNYNSYETSVKVTLDSVEDAIAFNVFHEGLHLGTILSLKKVLLQEEI